MSAINLPAQDATITVEFGGQSIVLTIGENTASAAASASLAQAWATGTLPGGAGTKSSREHAEVAEGAAAQAGAVLAAAALPDNHYATKAAAISDFANVAEGSLIGVVKDETKNNSFALYIKRFGAFEYQDSFALSDQSAVSTGVFFDSENGDSLLDLSIPAHASISATESAITFNSTTAVDLDVAVLKPDGNVLNLAVDYWEIDAEFSVRSAPAAGIPLVDVGTRNTTLGVVYASRLSAHPGGATLFLPQLINNGSARASGSSQAFTDPTTVRVRYRREGRLITTIVNYAGGADVSLTMTQDLVVGATERPRLFNKPFVRFQRGDMDLVKFKVSVSYPNPYVAFIGDSLTDGQAATAYENGFPQRFRASRPTKSVVIAGAAAAEADNASTTNDWRENIYHIIQMRPRYAVVLLGVNDLSAGNLAETVQADIASVVDQLVAADIIPIVLNLPPQNNFRTPTVNAWIAAQEWRSIDIYTTLGAGGNTLDAAYNSGDGVHWNDAGFEAVFSLIDAYFISEGL